MGYQVGKNEAVNAVRRGGIEGFVGETTGSVDLRESGEVKVGGYDKGIGHEVGFILEADVACFHTDGHTRIELLNVGPRCLGALGMYVLASHRFQ